MFSDSIEHVEEASRQNSMQQQVIIQLGDPTLLKASKSVPNIQITVGSFGTCLYAENINHTQGSNLSLPPQ